jgi:hypothetical protein
MELLPQVAAARDKYLAAYGSRSPRWPMGKSPPDSLPVGDGWSHILYALQKKLDHHRKYDGIIVPVAQIKVKMGYLCFYLGSPQVDQDVYREEDDGSFTKVLNGGVQLTKPQDHVDIGESIKRVMNEMRGAISMATVWCDYTCCECGRPGHAHRPHTHDTLCDGCWDGVKDELIARTEAYEREMKEYNDGHSDD